VTLHEHVKAAVRFGGWYRRGSGPSVAGLGDSITAGSHIAGTRRIARDSYFDVLAGYGEIVPLLNAGVRGQETHQILARVDDVSSLKPDVTLVIAGTNDVKNRIPVETAAANVELILDALSGRVILGTIPPLAVRAESVEQLNNRLRAISSARGLTMLDTYAVLSATAGGMASDGIHPSNLGASAVAREAQRVIG